MKTDRTPDEATLCPECGGASVETYRPSTKTPNVYNANLDWRMYACKSVLWAKGTKRVTGYLEQSVKCQRRVDKQQGRD